MDVVVGRASRLEVVDEVDVASLADDEETLSRLRVVARVGVDEVVSVIMMISMVVLDLDEVVGRGFGTVESESVTNIGLGVCSSFFAPGPGPLSKSLSPSLPPRSPSPPRAAVTAGLPLLSACEPLTVRTSGRDTDEVRGDPAAAAVCEETTSLGAARGSSLRCESARMPAVR